jgi:hypothetical protein
MKILDSHGREHDSFHAVFQSVEASPLLGIGVQTAITQKFLLWVKAMPPKSRPCFYFHPSGTAKETSAMVLHLGAERQSEHGQRKDRNPVVAWMYLPFFQRDPMLVDLRRGP